MVGALGYSKPGGKPTMQKIAPIGDPELADKIGILIQREHQVEDTKDEISYYLIQTNNRRFFKINWSGLHRAFYNNIQEEKQLMD